MAFVVKQFNIYSCVNCVFNCDERKCNLHKEIYVADYDSPKDGFPKNCPLVASDEILVKIGKDDG